MKVFAIINKWNVRGDTGQTICSAYEDIEDAFESLANAVKTDLKNISWFDNCEYCEMHDADGNEVVDTIIPDKLSYFLIQEKEEWQGEYYTEYTIEEITVYPAINHEHTEHSY